MLSCELGAWPPAKNSSWERCQAWTPPSFCSPLARAGRRMSRGFPAPAPGCGGQTGAEGPLLSGCWGCGMGPPWSSSRWQAQPGGSQLPPGTHRAVHGGAGIPQRCCQLPALLLFSRCWLRLLCWRQSLARPTPPSPQGLPPWAKHGGPAGGRVPSAHHAARSLAPVPITTGGGWCAGPSGALFPPHGWHCLGLSWGAC